MPILGVTASSISGHLIAPDTGVMFPIGMVSVGSAGASTITFSSIPSTYTHLQIRGILLASGASPQIRFNSDSGNNYSNHILYGSGTSDATGVNVSNSGMYIGGSATGTSATSPFAFITDILDYKNTNKNTTIKTLSGVDLNGSGEISLFSGAWYNAAAVSSLSIITNVNFAQYSLVALYGIKGA